MKRDQVWKGLCTMLYTNYCMLKFRDICSSYENQEITSQINEIVLIPF